jgi:M6 family metalloprotease-like protein
MRISRNHLGKFVASLLVALVALAGCSEDPQFGEVSSAIQDSQEMSSEVSGSSESQVDEAIPETASHLTYPDCDTPQVQNLTTVDNPDWRTFRVECLSDRSEAPEVLPVLQTQVDPEVCKLEDVSPSRLNAISRGVPDENYIVGFPRTESPYRLPDAELKVAVIPVDFSNYKDDVDPLTIFEPAAAMMDEFYQIYTRGAVTFDWYFHDQWVTIDEPIEKFTQSEGMAAAQWSQANVSVVDKFWEYAIAAADPVVDFTDVDMVYFVMPRDQDAAQEFNLWPPHSGSYSTEEGDIQRGFVPGSYQFRPDKSLWAFWIHETLHYFRLPDLYWHDQNSIKRSEFTLPGAIQGFDIMSNQDGVSKALSTWLMWLADWLEDSEVVCLDGSSALDGSVEISAVQFDDSKPKSAMIRMSDKEAIVIESRRQTQFDVEREMNRSRDGVIVYVVNTEIDNGAGLATILAPEGRTLIRMEEAAGNGDLNLDAVLYEGNFLEVGGFRIQVAQALADSDVINITKVEDWTSGTDPSYVCFTKANRDLAKDYPLTCPIVF